jgi:hypothetical protein
MNGSEYSHLSKSECGYSKAGRSFCKVLEGDEMFTKSLQIVFDFWKSKPNCHIDDPYGCFDAINKTGYWTTIGSEYELHHSVFL